MWVKILLRVILLAIVSMVAYGFYLKNQFIPEGDRWIGIGVLTMSFVLMPLFIWHRYKNKKLSDYQFDLEKLKDQFSDNK
jgi:hypothetical protein